MQLGVKICGVSTEEAVEAAVAHGAAFIGFVFYGRSPRVVTPAQAHRLSYHIPPNVWSVGLFVDADDHLIDQVLHEVSLNLLQLHGDESPERCLAVRNHFQRPVMKAIKIATPDDVQQAQRYIGYVDWLLFDAKPPRTPDALPGGNGVSFDWALLHGLHLPIPWMLSGGLDGDNLIQAVRMTGTHFVDVSSGVETSPGIKDVHLIRDFLDVAGQIHH